MTLARLKNNSCVRSALLCSALITPAILPATAFAQDQDQAEACMELQDAAANINFEESEISEDEFNQVVQSNDPEQCQTWLTEVSAEASVEGQVAETEQARVRLQDEVVIEGRVIVDQQPPEVQIEEQSAEVSVTNPPPDVNVTQEGIDIVIRQGAPVVSLDIPQPTITIEQPAPEIIVTMPDPTVDVANARPQIEVRQGEPRVQLSMPEPQVELDLYQAEDPENSPGIAIEQRNQQSGESGEQAQASVNINRAEPQITFQESDQQQANVNVSRSEPNISFESAEPQVEVSSSGEPQVNWSQTGEVTVRYQEAANAQGGEEQGGEQQAGEDQQSSDSDTQTASQGQGQSEQDQNAQQQMAQSSESGGPNVRRDGYEGVEAQEIEVSEIEGAMLFGVQGDEIGEIGALVLSTEEAETVIADISQMVGGDERRVEIPFSDLTFLRSEDGNDLRVYIDASEDQLMSYPEAG